MTQTIAPWRVNYTPGDWLVLAGPSSLVVLPKPSAELSARVEQLWFSVLGADTVPALLRFVAEAGFAEVADLGAFILGAEHVQALVRGRIRVLEGDNSEVLVAGEGTLTWRETELPDERRFIVDLGTENAGAEALPLLVGVVSAAELTLSTSPADLVRFPAAGGPAIDAAEPEPSEPDVSVAPEPVEDLAEEVEAIPEPEAAPEIVPVPESVAVEPEPEVVEDGLDAITDGGEDPLNFDTDPAAAIAAPVAGEVRSDPVVVPPNLGEVEEDNGGTIFSEGLAATHKPAAPPEEQAVPQVLAAPCINGHANAPGARNCRICQGPVDSSNPRLIRRPVLAGVHTNQGDFADIASGVIVGRAPDPSRGPGGSYLMRVTSPSGDISRNHLLVTAKEWTVTVTDLHSTNGTMVLPVGEAPFTLREGASVQVELGTVLDLGDGVSLRIEPPRG